MEKFKHLNKLLPYIDDAFDSFYQTMLNDVKLGAFFDDENQIKNLIIKQQQHFTATLSMPKSVMKNSYIKLGEFHHEIRIPYVDFIKGTEILEEHFLINTQKIENSLDTMGEIFEYFRMMKSFTAKGYLNKMLLEDKKDIDSFFEQAAQTEERHLPKNIILEKIQWLKELLHSIETNTEFNFVEKDSLLQEWLNEVDFLTLEKRTFFEDLEKRIMLNTQNLFYFLKKEEYLEILPLYSSLLSIYKLALMLNNAVTIEYANNIIDNMQFDSLTGLFRKDLFEEILKKEMSLVNREENYYISVTFIDIDNFKSVNDNFGHYSGDKVIEKLGETIRKNIRASDVGFRIGGDEFAIIFKNATKKDAKHVCKKIKVDFSSYEFIFNEDVTFSVGLSIGISEFPHTSKKDMKEFIESVDKKLYEAKNSGKNQISI